MFWNVTYRNLVGAPDGGGRGDIDRENEGELGNLHLEFLCPGCRLNGSEVGGI